MVGEKVEKEVKEEQEEEEENEDAILLKKRGLKNSSDDVAGHVWKAPTACAKTPASARSIASRTPRSADPLSPVSRSWN